MPKEEDFEPLEEHPRYSVPGTPLSRGSFGVVRKYKTIPLPGQRQEEVAIKFMQRGDKITKYIEYEILNHRVLRHPLVIQFKEAFLTKDHVCIVMEYANGGTMFSYVSQSGRLTEADAQWFFQQLILGIDYCHRKGIVNRDIKLENLLLMSIPNQRPCIKLCDFGYSKLDQVGAPETKVGTLAYMAPEVIAGNGQYDGKLSDLWSCGISLYAMLFGSYPFQPIPSNTVGENGVVLSQQQHNKMLMEEIIQSKWKVPEGMKAAHAALDLLGKLLTPDPAKRIDMTGLQAHPWFRENLPPGAMALNEAQLAKGVPSNVQSEDQVKALLHEAKTALRPPPACQIVQAEVDEMIDDYLEDESALVSGKHS